MGYVLARQWSDKRSHASGRNGSAPSEHTHTHDREGGEHQHGTVAWSVLAWSLIPLLLGVVVQPRPLGSESLGNNVGSAQATMKRFGPAAGDHPEVWNIWDWQRTYNANIHPNSWFIGKAGNMSGFVFHPQGIGPDQFVLARYVMRHCAADAFGVGMLVTWTQAENLPTDTWLQVTGTMDIQTVLGDETLLVNATKLDKLESPDNPYIFPSFYALPSP